MAGPQAFREWGQLLPDDIELFALSLPGRGSRLHEPLITSMDELVAQVIEGLSGYFDKPFVFFGHSAGALVAFEVTRQLEEGGYPLPLHLFVSAHKAPYLAPDEPLMVTLRDGQLLSLIGELGMVPEEVLNHPELLGLILPPLKADTSSVSTSFELSETYRWQQISCPLGTSPVSVPLTVLGGRYDELATAEDLERWAASTTKTFELAMFDGAHFYTQSHQAEVVEFIAQSIEATVSSLPKSIMRGERLPYPQKCLHELLREQAAKTPEAIALVSEDIQLTCRELDEQSDLLASYLQSMGVRVNSLVGIYMETSVEYVIAFFAALKAGGAYMTVEIAYPEALLQQLLNSAQPVVLLTKACPEHFYARLSDEWQCRAFKMDNGWVEQLASDPFIVPHNLPLPTIDSLAQCVMSSGTTGSPNCEGASGRGGEWARGRVGEGAKRRNDIRPLPFPLTLPFRPLAHSPTRRFAKAIPIKLANGKPVMSSWSGKSPARFYKATRRTSFPMRSFTIHRGWWITSTNIASQALFLCRDDAKAITMQNLTVSGGSLW